ncbi:response regulator [Motiliproteus sp. MSK22-1]|uniref:response regulator n=1 Tax=Motiliproteus sp. MSK22-1 TaxID=1897630 RepID=UPI000977E990|nr:response regulator [Motiliproteus sp. MSK22-1]OMH32142.1 Fis family transcriptional regulator [Motiliproteus sp. MSK22-1]
MATILAVDDSTTLRQMVTMTLKSSGHQVIEATNGKEALQAAQGKQVDLVLSDVNMPIMDGITLVKELRKISSYRLTPILMLTTESSADMKQQGKSAGATGWLVKPFSPDKLLATVKRVLG